MRSSLREDDGIRRLMAGDWPLQWSAKYEFVSDDPAKVTMDKKDAARSKVGSAIVPMIRNAVTSLHVISPYFVPGKKGTEGLIGRAKAGASVKILTNSLAGERRRQRAWRVTSGIARRSSRAACRSGSSSPPIAAP